MTDPASVVERRSQFSGFVIVTSEIADISTAINLEGLNAGKPHCFVAAQFFNDLLGVTPATPTAGTIVIQIETINNTPNFESPTLSTITAASSTTLSWAANTLSVTGTPADIVGATHYRLVVTCNET